MPTSQKIHAFELTTWINIFENDIPKDITKKLSQDNMKVAKSYAIKNLATYSPLRDVLESPACPATLKKIYSNGEHRDSWETIDRHVCLFILADFFILNLPFFVLFLLIL